MTCHCMVEDDCGRMRLKKPRTEEGRNSFYWAKPAELLTGLLWAFKRGRLFGNWQQGYTEGLSLCHQNIIDSTIV